MDKILQRKERLRENQTRMFLVGTCADWGAAIGDGRITFCSKPPAYPEFADANSGLTGGRYRFKAN